MASRSTHDAGKHILFCRPLMIDPISTHAPTGLLPASGGSASKATAAGACHPPRANAPGAGAIRRPPAAALQSDLSRTDHASTPQLTEAAGQTQTPGAGKPPAKALMGRTRLADPQRRTMGCTPARARAGAGAWAAGPCVLWEGAPTAPARRGRHAARQQSRDRRESASRGARGMHACVLLLRTRRAHDVPAGWRWPLAATVPTRTGESMEAKMSPPRDRELSDLDRAPRLLERSAASLASS
jgi:hypothetical protein